MIRGWRLPQPRNHLRPILDVEFAHDVLQVHLHGVARQVELSRNHLVRVTALQFCENVRFARREICNA